jgi:hypothetical protein
LDKNNFQAPSGAASSASDPFSKRAEPFSEYVAPPGLEILLILVSTNRPLLTELERRDYRH